MSLQAAENLEAQAAELRRIAAGWCSSGTPPDNIAGKILCSHPVLVYEDLIEDATAFEADAQKLRKLYT